MQPLVGSLGSAVGTIIRCMSYLRMSWLGFMECLRDGGVGRTWTLDTRLSRAYERGWTLADRLTASAHLGIRLRR